MIPTIITPKIPCGCRVLVTSDIHGHIEYLKNVLSMANFSKDDVLIVVGDITEKGPDSLNTVRFLMDLQKTHDVYVLAGNVDALTVARFDELDEDTAEKFCKRIIRFRTWEYKTSLFDEMARELGVPFDSAEDMLEAKPILEKHFAAELDFLRSRPTILSAGEYVFVHGGLRDSSIEENLTLDAMELLKYDRFFETSLRFEKYVVSGHWPVTLLNEKIANADPVIDRERKIIMIDGGCGLKTDGQLNLLEISDIFDPSSANLRNYRYDAFEQFTALDRQEPSERSISIHWGDTDIRLVEQGEEFSLVEHISTGYRLRMYNKYIYGFTPETKCNDYTDAVLAVFPGDTLSLVYETSEGCLVKCNGKTGWYFGRMTKN